MSHRDRAGISAILNKTNFRILAWYFNPVETKQTGLKHVKLLYQEPMQSTGKEKFTVYVYFKTRAYSEEDKEAWETSDEEDVTVKSDEKVQESNENNEESEN